MEFVLRCGPTTTTIDNATQRRYYSGNKVKRFNEIGCVWLATRVCVCLCAVYCVLCAVCIVHEREATINSEEEMKTPLIVKINLSL